MSGRPNPELLEHCLASFGEAQEITDEYYLSLYQRRRRLVAWLASTTLKRRIFPCIYVVGRKLPRAVRRTA